MDETPDDDLREALQRMSAAVRPRAAASDTVHAGIRRSRRRRALGAIAGTAGLVAAIAVGGHALAGSGPAPRQVQPDPATASPSAHAELFECSRESRVFSEAEPIADLDEQQEVVRRLSALSSVQVRYAAPSPLGVVALVVDHTGDSDLYADAAVAAQLREVGAAHVFEWDPSIASAGVDADGQIRQVLQWLLEPAFREVRRATRGLPGDAGLAFWSDEGAVLLQWKVPVPQQVLALAGVRPDGVEVRVEPVEYSQQDIRRAQRGLEAVLRERGLWDRWSTSIGCSDGSGLVVGMVPPLADRPQLQAGLTEALGLPVMIVPEERVIDLSPLKPHSVK
jgi:hypothetical protein